MIVSAVDRRWCDYPRTKMKMQSRMSADKEAELSVKTRDWRPRGDLSYLARTRNTLIVLLFLQLDRYEYTLSRKSATKRAEMQVKRNL